MAGDSENNDEDKTFVRDEVLAPRWSGLSVLLTTDEDSLLIPVVNDSVRSADDGPPSDDVSSDKV